MSTLKNELSAEGSLYLKQHENNPVNWQTFTTKTFDLAKTQNKLVLVSIGYSACHWCHVMEHECFEDPAVAVLMNEHFICIKVDREERPDIDQIYMNAVQIMTNKGGWPLNCFTLPDGRPIYGGTYFPKDQWTHILNSLVHTYRKDPNKVDEYATQLTEGIISSELIEVAHGLSDFPKSNLEEMILRWSKKMDPNDGGPTHAPKFPLPNNYRFLLRYGHLANNEHCKQHTALTLLKMARGGIYDQIGGGFARYSVDLLWKVPHFEKMLYDNGQLLSLYAEAYDIDPKKEYHTVVSQTVEWLSREMLSDIGGLYSAIDADSEGEEGKFYCWTKEEIESLLDKDEKWIKEYYNINQRGYWEDDKYILLREKSNQVFAQEHNLELIYLEQKINEINSKLFYEREKRVRPVTDKKILTGWNALTWSGLIHAATITQNEMATILANKIKGFICQNMFNNSGGIFRSYNLNKASIPGFLEDYAALIQAFIDDYVTYLDLDSLNNATQLLEFTLINFVHAESGMFYFTEKNTELIARKMETQDNVIPSSNSIMAKNLYRLGIITNNRTWLERSKQMVSNMIEGMIAYGSGYANWASLHLNFSLPIHEIGVFGPDAIQIIKEIRRSKRLDVFLYGAKQNESIHFESKWKPGINQIFHCVDQTCQAPVTCVDDLWKSML